MSAKSAKPGELLSQIRIASPCSARWEEMTGDERTRFCQHCQKHVYNFTAMTTAEAVALIQSKEGRLCGRFYQRPDGTLIAADCPVGLARVRQQARRAALAIATLVAFLFTTVAWAKHSEQKGAAIHKGKATAKVEETVNKIKAKLGVTPPPRMIAGEICVLPAPKPAPTKNSSAKTNP